MVEVNIQGVIYDVDVDSMEITALNGNTNYVYATFEAWDTLFEEPVKLQYVSVNRSKPIAEKPYRIIREEIDDRESVSNKGH